MTYDEASRSERQDRKHQDFIWVRLAMIVMNSCGWVGLCAKVLKIHATKTLHVDLWHKAQAFIALDIFLLFFYVNHFFDFMSLLISLITLRCWLELWPQFSSSFCAVRFSGNGGWSFYPYSKWPFIENVNRRIRLPMLRKREELNCSQWAQSEDLIRPWTTSHVFHLCGDDLPPDWNQPELIPCLPLSGDSCPSNSNWLLTSFW